MPSFGVTGGTLKDVSGNGNDGTLNNMDAASDWVGTSKGLALDFDGVNDYVSCGNKEIFKFTTALTLECWVKTSSTSTYNHFISRYPSSSGSYAIGSVATSGFLFFARSTNGSDQGLSGTVSYNVCDGKWNHLVASYNSLTSTLLLSVNGSISSSYLTGSIYEGNSSLDIGRRSGVGQYYPSNIGSVRIYNRALSPSEIKQLYLNPSAPFERKQQTVGISTEQAFNPYWANQATQLAGTLQ